MFGDAVTVKFIAGRTPELITVDADGNDINRENVESYTYDGLVKRVQELGFALAGDDQSASNRDEHAENLGGGRPSN